MVVDGHDDAHERIAVAGVGVALASREPAIVVDPKPRGLADAPAQHPRTQRQRVVVLHGGKAPPGHFTRLANERCRLARAAEAMADDSEHVQRVRLVGPHRQRLAVQLLGAFQRVGLLRCQRLVHRRPERRPGIGVSVVACCPQQCLNRFPLPQGQRARRFAASWPTVRRSPAFAPSASTLGSEARGTVELEELRVARIAARSKKASGWCSHVVTTTRIARSMSMPFGPPSVGL
jgi:hypothetical protein